MVAIVGAEAPQAPLKDFFHVPKTLELSRPRTEQRLGVLGEYGDGHKKGSEPRGHFLTSDDAQIVRVDKSGVVRPLKDGQATLTITSNGVKATLSVKVKNTAAETPVKLAQSRAGADTRRLQCRRYRGRRSRRGFDSSAFGFDPAFDYQQIVQSNEGRRVVPSIRNGAFSCSNRRSSWNIRAAS